MFTFLLVVHAIIAAILVGVILMQRSEGGGLGMGGSPTGLMSARGAADFLTRATTILASLFVILSITLAVIATRTAAPTAIDTSLARQAPAAPAPAVPLGGDPLAAAANSLTPVTGPAPAGPVPLATAPAARPAQRKPVTASATSKPVRAPIVTPTVPAETRPAPAPLVIAPTSQPTAPPGNSN